MRLAKDAGVGFVLRRGKPEAIELARDMIADVRSAGHPAVVIAQPDGDAAAIATLGEVGATIRDEGPGATAGLGFIVALGGDGTLLHTAGLVDRPIPILAVNLGYIGFLTAFSPTTARGALAAAIAGSLVYEERLRANARLIRGDGTVVERDAANDVVLSHGAIGRLIEIEARWDGELVTRYRADGLIVATPSGSTAYNLSAGGPILTPDASALVLTPICPHTLTNRAVVLPLPPPTETQDRCLSLEPRTENLLYTVDGQVQLTIGPTDRIEVRRSRLPIRLYSNKEGYFDVLRKKLRWGET